MLAEFDTAARHNYQFCIESAYHLDSLSLLDLHTQGTVSVSLVRLSGISGLLDEPKAVSEPFDAILVVVWVR